MEEAKTLLHHALSALFGVLILAAVSALIALGYMMWGAFAKQDEANYKLREYAKYSAFDGTTVRGQDVISLLHNTQGQPWVLIMYKNETGTYVPASMIYTSADWDFTITTSLLPINADTELSACITALGTTNTPKAIVTNMCGGTPPGVEAVVHFAADGSLKIRAPFNFSSDVSKPSYSELQEWFMLRGKEATKTPTSDGIAGYLPYKSHLVYEDDYSTDVIGIVLIEQKE